MELKGNSLENYPCLVSSLQFPDGICLMGLYLSLLTKLDFCRYIENIRISDQSRDFTSHVWNTDCQVKIIREKRTK